MLYQIQPLNPVAIDLGFTQIYWYGLIIGFGAFLGYILANREAIRRGLPKDLFADLLLYAIPIAILTSRLYYVIFKWDHYSQHPGKILAIWEGGLAIHGGLIGAIITGYIFAKKRGVSFWKLADIAAPSILLGQAIGRWGNFMNQEAHGGPVDPEFLQSLFIPQFIINQMYIDGVYYHPTFLYESVWSLIGVALLIYARRLNFRRGELFLSYVIWYSVGRFFIEGMRTDSLYIIGTLRTAQVISILLIAGAVALIFYRRKTGLSTIRYLDEEPTEKKKKSKKKKK
ncbi:prolipoprotein diacylglyceryl transferase [Anaerobacillus alkalidiazotrophicus]|uniref:Phosphatidylglycerol--prolipoprotein diacylglyceryl transferase n=1 Tax=Anaerobacillus alkalidiazotrophicus TaxID=472963 RepID=A0A1S2M8U2_9BACI|nr:prolipoprotein diacylglyceryl transferase [Anaerobacillus alkalidiazotrophicus]OIJ21016.1 prolipoprotein diacylglyceryl transferase [Anaerobacillus alkalidiazotrophicus]